MWNRWELSFNRCFRLNRFFFGDVLVLGQWVRLEGCLLGQCVRSRRVLLIGNRILEECLFRQCFGTHILLISHNRRLRELIRLRGAWSVFLLILLGRSVFLLILLGRLRRSIIFKRLIFIHLFLFRRFLVNILSGLVIILHHLVNSLFALIPNLLVLVLHTR